MTIPTKTRKKWKLLRDHGDVKKIIDKYGKDYPAVYKLAVTTALNEGECSEDLFKVLSEFYNDREKLLKTA